MRANKIPGWPALALALLVFSAALADAAAETPVRVRFGQHAGFHRMVFDWPETVAYRVEKRGAQVLLSFEAPANLDLSRYYRIPPSLIRDLTPARIGGGAAVRFAVPPNARVEHRAWGNKVVVDVFKPAYGGVSRAAPYSGAQTGQTTGSAVPQTAPSAAPAARAAPAPPAATPPAAVGRSAPAPAKPQQRQPAQLRLDLAEAGETEPERRPAVEDPEPEVEIRYVDPTPRFSVGANASTLGIGGEGGYQVNDFLGLRLVGNYLPVDFDFDTDDVSYDAEVDWRSAGVVVDIYPFGGTFRLTGGARYNANEIDLDATPRRNVDIGGQTFTPSEVGTIDADVDFDNFAPYVGLGWEDRWFGGHLGFSFDLGVYYQGDVSVDGDADGTLANDPDFQQALAREIREIEDELDFFSWYPVVGVSVTIRF